VRLVQRSQTVFAQPQSGVERSAHLDADARARMVELSGRTSVPQIFVGDTHVGGYDDLMALHRAGTFEPLLAGASS